MSKRTIVYDDFSGGEFGSLEAWKAPANTFTGTNMIVTRSGELCVRPGVRNTTPSNANPYGSLSNIGGSTESSFGVSYVWYTDGAAVRRFNPCDVPTPVTTAATGVFTGIPFGIFNSPSGSIYYIVTGNEGVYSYDPFGHTLTTLNGTRDGQSVCQYGDRLMVSNGANLHYSDASVFTSFPTANVIVVGDASDDITALMPQKNHLLIFKGTGGIYMLTGVPGVNETLRQVTRHIGVYLHPAVNRSLNEKVWFHNIKSFYPSVFDGAEVRDLSYLGLQNIGASASASAVAQVRSEDPDAACILVRPLNTATPSPFSSPVLLRHRGIWTRHDFGTTIHSELNPSMGAADTIEGFLASPRTAQHPQVTPVLTWAGVTQDGGIQLRFYSWSPFMDRPGTEYQTTGYAPERAGDNSSAQVAGNVAFPEWHADLGMEVRVREITVDFRKWRTGGSLTNHFDLTATALRTYDNGARTSRTLAWDEADVLSGDTGTQDRKTFSFGDQGQGNAFQIGFSNCRGIAITRFFVTVEITPARI